MQSILDFYSVHGMPGIHLANVVVNYNDEKDLRLKTMITFDNGGEWRYLPPPEDVFCNGVHEMYHVSCKI